MYIRKENGWELWSGCHPATIGCVSEGRGQCDCKYHLVDSSRTKIESFSDYASAASRFQQLTGVVAFTINRFV